jgi:O-antigen ligase
LCFAVYLIALNSTEDSTFVYKIIKLIFIIICIQVIIEAFMGTQSFFGDTYFYKHDMTIPIGNSNAIASKIIALFAFLKCVEKDKKSKVMYLFLLLVAVALTKSRGGVLTALASIGLVFFWKGKVSTKNIIKLVAALLLIGVGFYFFKEFSSIGEFIFSASTSTVTGREGLWRNGLRIFCYHPLFGNGFSDLVVNNNPHNFIIDTLMRSGIAGIILMISIVGGFIYKVKNYTTDNYVRGCICFALCLLAQGLVEIVLFSYVHDMMLWFVLGTMCCRVNQLKMSDAELKKESM